MTGAQDHGTPLRLGTRGSRLALIQARWVADRVTATCGRTVELVTVSTAGDQSDAPIERIGVTGVFVTALREALVRGEVDFVVHSFKDLPGAPLAGVRLAAVPGREDPRDGLIWPAGSGRLEDLPPGTRVATGSPRRAAQVRALAPGVEVVSIRGNVDTRLRKLADGAADALILAMAGLARLGRLAAVSTPLDPSVMMPAPAQGALAVECRTNDMHTTALLAMVDDPAVRATVTAERGFLTTLEAGCTAPVGALARTVRSADGRTMLHLDGLVAAPDGSTVLRQGISGAPSAAIRLGRELALSMLRVGGADLVGLASSGRSFAPASRGAGHG